MAASLRMDHQPIVQTAALSIEVADAILPATPLHYVQTMEEVHHPIAEEAMVVSQAVRIVAVLSTEATESAHRHQEPA